MTIATNPAVIDNILIEKNLSMHQLQYHGLKSNIATNGTLTLTVDSESIQILTGTSTGVRIRLPDATNLGTNSPSMDGIWHYIIVNDTSFTKEIYYNDNTTLLTTLAQNSFMYLYCHDTSTANGQWFSWQVLTSSVATGIINYNISSAVNFSTTSTSYVPITGFTLTPQAGTYACWYNGRSFLNTTPREHWWVFYKNGAIVTQSERSQDTSHSDQGMVDTAMAILQFNGSESIDVRVKTENGTLQITPRTMILIRIGT